MQQARSALLDRVHDAIDARSDSRYATRGGFDDDDPYPFPITRQAQNVRRGHEILGAIGLLEELHAIDVSPAG